MLTSRLPEYVAELVNELAAMPGTVAVVLGGSHAIHNNDTDSDWDLGLYYRGDIVAEIPTYTLSAELAMCQPLHGERPAAPFPPKLAVAAPPVWRFCRSFSLDRARMHARRGNVAGTGGQAAAAIMEAHALMCERSQWVCNEKRLIESAGLGNVQELFSQIPVEPVGLVRWVDLVAQRLGAGDGSEGVTAGAL